MSFLLSAIISNIFVATMMGLSIWVLGKRCRNPFLMYTLWMLVLVKLVTPPLVTIPCLPDWQINQVAFQGIDNPVLGSDGDSDLEPVPQNDFLTRLWMSFNNFETNMEPETRNDLSESLADSSISDASSSLQSQNTVAEAAKKSIGPGLRPIDFVWMAVLFIWMMGSVIYLTKIYSSWRSLRATLQLGVQSDGAALRPLSLCVERIAKKMGLKSCPNVLFVDAIVPPMVWPDSKQSVLVVPQFLLSKLSSEKLEVLIAHELAHLQFLHHWFRRFEILVKAIYWWFPLLGVVSKTIRQHEEAMCDARVVQLLPEHAKSYANLLIDTSAYLASNERMATPIVLGMSSFSLLNQRVLMIMTDRIQTRFSVFSWLVVFAITSLLPLAPIPNSTRSLNTERLAQGDEAEADLQDQDQDEEIVELPDDRRTAGIRQFSESAMDAELGFISRKLDIAPDVLEKIDASLEADLNNSVLRGLRKENANVAFFRHVGPELENSIWEKTRKHLSVEKSKLFDAYVEEAGKRSKLAVKLSQETISLFLAQNLSLSEDQNEQIKRLLEENWDPSWRGIIFVGVDYALFAEGAMQMLKPADLTTILSAEQLQAFANLDNYVINNRKLLNVIDREDIDKQEEFFGKLEDACVCLMRLKSDQLAETCGLNAEHHQRLIVSGKRVAENLTTHIKDVLCNRAGGHNEAMEDPEYFSVISRPLIDQCVDQEIWSQTVEDVLTPKQIDQMKAGEVRWQQRDKDRMCYFVMMYFNRRRFLAFETQIAASKLLIEKIEYSSKGNSLYNLLGSIPKVPEEDWRKIIPDDKWDKFVMILESLRQMTPAAQDE